jgi:GTP cyclohydrolase II
MKELEKVRPYRDYIRGLVCRVHVQEATHDTLHCLRCDELVYVEISVMLHLCKDLEDK